MRFEPATNKLEAVQRLAALTNAPEERLGPGSKERKSVLINLAIGLGISFSHELTKQQLAKHIARKLGVEWLPAFESTGQTLTLSGLNQLLAAASYEISNNPLDSDKPIADAFSNELVAIARILERVIPAEMDGETCVREMRAAGDSNWKQVQWQGFYFEMIARRELNKQIGGTRQRLFNTDFDYVRNFVWDMKAHSSENERGQATNECILNDARATEKAIEDSGLGFIILTGKPLYDMEFTRWHKAFRGGGTDEPGRKLKKSFTPEALEIFFVKDRTELESAVSSGALKIVSQGKNSNGKPRPDKYSLDLSKARGGNLQVFSRQLNLK